MPRPAVGSWLPASLLNSDPTKEGAMAFLCLNISNSVSVLWSKMSATKQAVSCVKKQESASLAHDRKWSMTEVDAETVQFWNLSSRIYMIMLSIFKDQWWHGGTGMEFQQRWKIFFFHVGAEESRKSKVNRKRKTLFVVVWFLNLRAESTDSVPWFYAPSCNVGFLLVSYENTEIKKQQRKRKQNNF